MGMGLYLFPIFYDLNKIFISIFITYNKNSDKYFNGITYTFLTKFWLIWLTKWLINYCYLLCVTDHWKHSKIKGFKRFYVVIMPFFKRACFKTLNQGVQGSSPWSRTMEKSSEHAGLRAFLFFVIMIKSPAQMAFDWFLTD